jgi:nitronate monooxygenase
MQSSRRGRLPNLVLLPRAGRLKIPFVAPGCMTDARSLGVAMGAQGMNMGTRFIATKKALVHENVKQTILAATELDTRLVMRGLRATERVLNNAGVERSIEIERERAPRLRSRHHRSGGRRLFEVMVEVDAGALSYGMVSDQLK